MEDKMKTKKPYNAAQRARDLMDRARWTNDTYVCARQEVEDSITRVLRYAYNRGVKDGYEQGNEDGWEAGHVFGPER